MATVNETARTRVRPVFKQLTAQDPSGVAWLEPLLALSSRAAELELPSEAGWAGPLQKPPSLELPVPAPLDFLEHLVKNPRKLRWPRDADGEQRVYRSAIHQRRKALLAANVPAQQEAIRDIRKQQQKGPDPAMKDWWVLEGAAEIDCALFAEGVTVFIEGKRDEKTLKVHGNWYERRIQLYRKLDCLRTLPGRAERFYVLALVETGTPIEVEARAMSRDFQFARASWPQLETEDAAELWTHFLGYATWQQVAERFAGIEFPKD